MLRRKAFVVWGVAILVSLGTLWTPVAGGSGPARVWLKVMVLGRGTVTSSPKGISCPIRCSARVRIDARIRLIPRAATGWRFSSWSGGCVGARQCVAKVVLPTVVRAKFTKITPPPAVGSQLNPVPLGQSAAIGDGWT